MSGILTEAHRIELVFGYIRQNVNVFYPDDLTNICYKYYNDIIDWILNGDKLQQFYNSKHEDIFYGPTLTINKIPFQLLLYPKGNKQKNDGYVIIYLHFLKDKLPKDIIHFTIYCHFFCSVSRVQWKNQITMKYLLSRGGRRSGWFRYNMAFDNVKNKGFKSITFGCHTDLIDIKYDRKCSILCSPYNQTSISIKCEYEWILNHDILNAFNTATSGQCYYSPNFDGGCWCIVVIPKGRISDIPGKMRIFIKILRFPHNIGSIWIKYKLELLSDIEQDEDMTFEFVEKFGHINKKHLSSATLSYIPLNDIFNSALSIKVFLEIMRIFDVNDLEIDRDTWSDYNVL